jgi:hypothetical protein
VGLFLTRALLPATPHPVLILIFDVTLSAAQDLLFSFDFWVCF